MFARTREHHSLQPGAQPFIPISVLFRQLSLLFARNVAVILVGPQSAFATGNAPINSPFRGQGTNEVYLYESQSLYDICHSLVASFITTISEILILSPRRSKSLPATLTAMIFLLGFRAPHLVLRYPILLQLPYCSLSLDGSLAG